MIDGYYPAYIVDGFLLLLGNIFEGQTGLHIVSTEQGSRESFELYGSRRIISIRCKHLMPHFRLRAEYALLPFIDCRLTQMNSNCNKRFV